MSTASRVIWFNEDVITFRNETTGHEFRSGDTVTADSNDTSTTFRITLKDSSKHWATGNRGFWFTLGDPDNPVNPFLISGFDNINLNSNYFTFTSAEFHHVVDYDGYNREDKEISLHFNALLDNNNNVVQDKDIVTNNPNVVASSSFSLGFGDQVTIKAKPGYKITSVKMYDRSTGTIKFIDYTKSLDSNGNLDITFHRAPIPKAINDGMYHDRENVWGYYAKVTTEPTEPSEPSKPPVDPAIDFIIKYNNGLTDVTNTVPAKAKETISGTVTAGTGYTITGVTGAKYQTRPGHYIGVKDFVATKISDYEYSYSFTAPSYRVNITIDVQTKKIPGNINIDTTGLVNCSVSPATIQQGTQSVLTLNANAGYVLNGSGNYIVDGTTNNFTVTNASSYQITVAANKSVSIVFSATKIETKPGSIIHTYVLTQDEYNVLGKQIIAGVNSTGTGFDSYDYTKFVNYLYQIPFDVVTDNTTSSSSINLGKQNLPIDSRKVTNETINVDLGTIDLTDVHNSHDLQPLTITLYCPFSSNITLPSTVIGSKLYLSFSINLKTEQALLLIKQNGNIIYSGQTELFTDLPLYYSAGNKDSIVKQLKAQYQNSIKQAYIVVNYNKPITDLTSYKTNEHGTMSSYKGFTRVSHGTLKKSVSSEIDDALMLLLRQGVIIK